MGVFTQAFAPRSRTQAEALKEGSVPQRSSDIARRSHSCFVAATCCSQGTAAVRRGHRWDFPRLKYLHDRVAESGKQGETSCATFMYC